MIKITPFFSSRPWAGEFISKFFGISDRDIGEAWLLSTLPEGESQVGTLPLSRHLGKKLPYLIKVIDASLPLSVQVHPDDNWAQQLENSKGKTECWLVLDSTVGGGVYLGVKSGVSLGDLKNALEKNFSVDELLNFYPVSRGDFITVPAGTIHAIGGGVTLLEVQQASGITYRLWDWGRTARELHLEKGLKVANLRANYQVSKNILSSSTVSLLFKHPDFECNYNQYQGEGWFINLESLEVFQSSVPPKIPYLFVR